MRNASRPRMSAVMIACTTATKINAGASAPSTRNTICAIQSRGRVAGPNRSPASTPNAMPVKMRTYKGKPVHQLELPARSVVMQKLYQISGRPRRSRRFWRVVDADELELDLALRPAQHQRVADTLAAEANGERRRKRDTPGLGVGF